MDATVSRKALKNRHGNAFFSTKVYENQKKLVPKTTFCMITLSPYQLTILPKTHVLTNI